MNLDFSSSKAMSEEDMGHDRADAEVKKVKRRPRPKSPRQQGGSPTDKIETDLSLRKSPTSRRNDKPHVPSNPDRGRGGKLPSNPSRDASPQKGDKAPVSPRRRSGSAPSPDNTTKKDSTHEKSTKRSTHNNKSGKEKSPKRSGESRSHRARSPDHSHREGGRNSGVKSPSRSRHKKKSSRHRSKGKEEPESPQYLSSKDESTMGLQLDIGKMSGDMPLFSLLDENSLVSGDSDDLDNDNDISKTMNNSSSHIMDNSSSHIMDNSSSHRMINSSHKMNNSSHTMDISSSCSSPVRKKNSLGGSQTKFPKQEPRTPEVSFKPWSFDNHKKETGAGEAKRQITPTSIKNAVKAFKYTKPSMSTNMMKLSSNFRQGLGLAPKHQQMKDDDDDDDLKGLL